MIKQFDVYNKTIDLNKHVLTLHYESTNLKLANWNSEIHELFFILVFWIIIGLKWFIENWAFFICNHFFFAFWVILMIVVKSSLIIDCLKLLNKNMFPDDALIYMDDYWYFRYHMFMGKLYKALTLWIQISIFMSILVFQTAFTTNI